MPNVRLYFCLSNHINEIMIKLIFRKLWILNQFFNFYFLNMNISLNNYAPVIRFKGGALNIILEGTVSQNFDLGLSYHFIFKKRITFGHFLKLFFLDCIK